MREYNTSNKSATFHGFYNPEKNFFPMPNNWTDITAEINNLAELKVIEYVMRHTWGFHEFGIKKTITTDEFMYGRKRKDGSRMDKGTGLAKQSVVDGLKRAIFDGYLVFAEDTSDMARREKSYALNMASDVQNLDTDKLNIRCLDSRHLNPDKSDVQNLDADVQNLDADVQDLDIRCPESRHRSEKETKEKHLKKNTREKKEERAVDPIASSSSSLQNVSSQKKKTKDEHTHTTSHSQSDTTSQITKKPAPRSLACLKLIFNGHKEAKLIEAAQKLDEQGATDETIQQAYEAALKDPFYSGNMVLSPWHMPREHANWQRKPKLGAAEVEDEIMAARKQKLREEARSKNNERIEQLGTIKDPAQQKFQLKRICMLDPEQIEKLPERIAEFPDLRDELKTIYPQYAGLLDEAASNLAIVKGA